MSNDNNDSDKDKPPRLTTIQGGVAADAPRLSKFIEENFRDRHRFLINNKHHFKYLVIFYKSGFLDFATILHGKNPWTECENYLNKGFKIAIAFDSDKSLESHFPENRANIGNWHELEASPIIDALPPRLPSPGNDNTIKKPPEPS